MKVLHFEEGIEAIVDEDGKIYSGKVSAEIEVTTTFPNKEAKYASDEANYLLNKKAMEELADACLPGVLVIEKLKRRENTYFTATLRALLYRA